MKKKWHNFKYFKKNDITLNISKKWHNFKYFKKMT